MSTFHTIARTVRDWWWMVAFLALACAAVITREQWLPLVMPAAPAAGEHDAHAHAEDGHDHAAHAHGPASSVKLSPQGQANIGLKIGSVKLSPFERTATIPGIIVERPGRSTVEITAPLTGVVTRIYSNQGEAVTPGQLLFDVRMTHEELIATQSEFLKTAEELDVIRREMTRLEKVSAEGALPAKTLLERKYEFEKHQASLRAQRQALILHGLSDEQIDAILKTRELLKNLTVVVPPPDKPVPKTTARPTNKPPEKTASLATEATTSPTETVYQIQQVKVEQGQHVTAGDRLCVLADHANLYIEGKAFEQDMPEISQAIQSGALLKGRLEGQGAKTPGVSGLKIVYLSSQVDQESRAFSFFVSLPNELLRDGRDAEGHRYIDWRYKPGQRMQIRVPVETWTDRIVLPVDALAQDGVETYVFQPNGNNFERRPVHVEYRDDSFVVIANDGSIFPDDFVALSGAQQLQLQLKNLAGGGVDPHAGHNH